MPVLSQAMLGDPVTLTSALVDIESVSGHEDAIADAVRQALAGQSHLTVERDGNVVVARTRRGDRPPGGRRVVLAGHLDTVPVAANLPAKVDAERITGCGATDMKSGVAVALHLAATVTEPAYDMTYLFYDCEEIEAARNGLRRVAKTRPEWFAADFAILLEPTDGRVEAGCQGTLRVMLRIAGRRAHAARSWLGDNAIHAAGSALARLSGYQARTVDIDGCTYREGLNAVAIAGGVAGNVIPDECVVEVNFRFAPDRSEADAEAHVREVLAGFALEVTDSAPGALPGLTAPAAQEFLAAVDQPPVGKLGWTDVSQFAALGIPALNYGPGDPNLAHTREEYVAVRRILDCTDVLRRWLTR